MKRVIVLLFIGLCAMQANPGRAAETRVLGYYKLDDISAFAESKLLPGTVGFQADPKAGPVWVAYYFLGALHDSAKLGGIGLSATPEGVPVSLGNATITINSPNMAIPDLEPGVGLQVEFAGTPITVSEEDLRQLLGDDAASTALAEPDALRHLVVIRHYQIPDDNPTAMSIEVLRVENMQPLTFEMVVGQGPVPETLQAFETAINGNWISRNRVPSAILGSIGLFAIWVFRRLSR
ncbi:hypothetical protein HPT27_02410 [Permianibacter sp. IMCC34836]|uniref:hypothetical protein n=1 Tax=Permianibacter fluminis TaxID=2738515 RepID=UPI001556017F|nr:hypothetical protein [Permianibacter fluminis]NQD35857.1 hypothetical protein [Permianibacter fluminis]